MGRPDLVGRRRQGEGAHRRVRQRPRRPRRPTTRWARHSTTSRCSTSWPARRTTSRRSRRSPRASLTVAARPRPARAAQPVHRRARRGRLHRPDQRQGRRRRRPGLERDAAADVRAVGGAAQARRSRSTASPRAPRQGSCRPSSRCGRYAYGLMTSERGTHRLVTDQPVRQRGPAPDEVRGRPGVAGDGRPGRVARRRRHPDGGVPCQAPVASTSARRLGGAADRRADRPHRQLAGGSAASCRIGRRRWGG